MGSGFFFDQINTIYLNEGKSNSVLIAVILVVGPKAVFRGFFSETYKDFFPICTNKKNFFWY
jgi:hypothetical protein